MAKPGRVQAALEYGVARSLLTVLSILPRPLAATISLGMGRVAYMLAGRLRRTGERNLQLAFPQISARERSHILRGSFKTLGRVLGEFSHFASAHPETLRRMVVCEGLENLEAARACGRGVILFSGHFGAWDFPGFALSLLGYQLSFLVRHIDNPKINRLVAQTRTRFGNRLIDKRAAARPMLETLRAGGMLGMLADTNMLKREGIFVDFFGVPASTTFILAKVALRTGAVVLPVFAPWDNERGCFVLHIDAPLSIERTGDEEEDVRRLTALCTSVIENYVRRYPDQWLWIHKRWRTRPPGEPDIYE